MSVVVFSNASVSLAGAYQSCSSEGWPVWPCQTLPSGSFGSVRSTPYRPQLQSLLHIPPHLLAPQVAPSTLLGQWESKWRTILQLLVSLNGHPGYVIHCISCVMCGAKYISSTLTSSRRSHCVPTRTSGAKGTCFRISGTHFSGTFWKEVGLTTLKHSRNTSALV